MKRIKLYLHSKNGHYFWDTWRHKGDWEEFIDVKWFDLPEDTYIGADGEIYRNKKNKYDHHAIYPLDIHNTKDNTPVVTGMVDIYDKENNTIVVIGTRKYSAKLTPSKNQE